MLYVGPSSPSPDLSLGAILTSFAKPHIGVVPRRGNEVVAQFEMST